MIGDIISAGGRLIGGFLDRDTANKNRDSQERMAAQNIALQKQFAQEGIRWKVEDARQAGIHPLYALGANTTSFSPVSISGGSSSNWSDTLGAMGQDVSRAMQSTRTADERVDAFTKTAQALELEGKKLDNDIKRASLASSVARNSASRAQIGPALPGSVHPRADGFEDIPRLRGHSGEIETEPRVTNAEQIEERYGDLIQEAWGIYTAASDWLNHAKRQTAIRDVPRSGTWRDWVPRFSFKRHYYDPRRDAR